MFSKKKVYCICEEMSYSDVLSKWEDKLQEDVSVCYKHVILSSKLYM